MVQWDYLKNACIDPTVKRFNMNSYLARDAPIVKGEKLCSNASRMILRKKH